MQHGEDRPGGVVAAAGDAPSQTHDCRPRVSAAQPARPGWFTDCPRWPAVREMIWRLPPKPNRGRRPPGSRKPCGWHYGSKVPAAEVWRHFARCPPRPRASPGRVPVDLAPGSEATALCWTVVGFCRDPQPDFSKQALVGREKGATYVTNGRAPCGVGTVRPAPSTPTRPGVRRARLRRRPDDASCSRLQSAP